MDQTQYIKHESKETRVPSEEGAFETYINADFVEENANTGELDLTNTDMLCYLMDSDLGSINQLMEPLMDPSNVFYYDSNLVSNYESYMCQTSTPSSDAQHPQPKRKAGRRKAAKSSTPFGSEMNDLASRPDLILSPEEMEMVAKASPKERRQIRNKISARNFRLRRKEYVTSLEVKASKYDEDLGNLRVALDRAEHDKAHLRSCVDDLVHKFKLLTTQVPELRKFKDLDPLHEIATSAEGQLISVVPQLASPPSQANHISCRVSFDPSEQESHDTNNHFPTSRPHTFMVKA